MPRDPFSVESPAPKGDVFGAHRTAPHDSHSYGGHSIPGLASAHGRSVSTSGRIWGFPRFRVANDFTKMRRDALSQMLKKDLRSGDCFKVTRTCQFHYQDFPCKARSGPRVWNCHAQEELREKSSWHLTPSASRFRRSLRLETPCRSPNPILAGAQTSSNGSCGGQEDRLPARNSSDHPSGCRRA